MLISPSLIFVHNPRTGGTSVRSLLQASLPYRYLPVNDPEMTPGQKQWALHQGMDFAHQYAQRLGLDPNLIPTLVCIRNPYDHVLSGYKYLASRPAGTVPDLEADFRSYVLGLHKKLTSRQRALLENAPYGLNSKYLLVGRTQPSNLFIARTESLDIDVAEFIRKRLGVEPVHEVKRQNASTPGGRKEFYGPEEEEIVYRLHKQMFDRGMYQRYEGLSF
ncbi:MAG: hypothetical protein V2J20_03815 [Wenzhouxiangella sp.]|jgi:hypothetical protein|nr:hypothetical protein [Wenzhouxiangella sp.]